MPTTFVPTSNTPRVPSRRRNLRSKLPSVAPAGPPSLSDRDKVLAEAGLDFAKKVEIARKAVRVLDDAMDATKVDRAAWQGQFNDERTDADHATRLRAAEQAADLAGFKPPRVEVQGGQPVIIPIVFADFARPQPRVIEMEAEVREIKDGKPVGEGSVTDSASTTKDVTDAQVPADVDAAIVEPGLEPDPTPTPQKRGKATRGGPTPHSR